MSSWQSAACVPALDAETIHVWKAELPTLASCVPWFDSLLDVDERTRGNQYHASSDRIRHVVSRGMLRALAAQYLGAEPCALRFGSGEFGKPFLAATEGASLAFNVSHSGDIVLLAFARSGDVGIDVEQWNDRLGEQERIRIGESVFSPSERHGLRVLPSSEQQRGFYDVWSRKEAYLKGLGVGISRSLAQIDVSVGDEARLIADYKSPGNSELWSLHALDVGAGYSAALAARPRGRRMDTWLAQPLHFGDDG